jgi:hypothetical protein
MSLFPEFNSCRQNSYLPLHKKGKKENPTTHKRPMDSVKELLDRSNSPQEKKKKPQQQQKLSKD